MKRYFIPLLLLFTPLLAHGQIISSGRASCAILEGGILKCWGNNAYGQLGYEDTANRGDVAGQMGEALPAIDLGAGRTATAIAVGNNHTCAILAGGTVKCWGNNGLGQLGQGHTQHLGDNEDEMGDNLPAVDLGTGRTATAIAAGSEHTCAILDGGSVKCWGYNGFGQLGQGHTQYRGDNEGEMGDALPAVDLGTGRAATAITAGNNHTCAILNDGTVKCWGSGGRLGYGDGVLRGAIPSHMGNNLPAVNLGTGRTATAITAGSDHTCAILDNGMLKCWGLNDFGQLGYGNTTYRGTSPNNNMGDNLPAVDLGTGRTATTIATGQNHTCAILDDGTVKCWGHNSSGQLGQGHIQTRGFASNQMGDNLSAVDLGAGRTAVALSSGLFNNTCAILDNGMLKCWGHNDFGQLGYGDTAYRGGHPDEMGDALLAVDLAGGALPVELTTFTVTLDGTSALLRWTTASETNNAGFDVEHRSGSEPFRTVGFAAGRGTTAEASSYSHTVAGLTPGTHVFRLKQIDFDGAFAYSPEVELTLRADGLSLTLRAAGAGIEGMVAAPQGVARVEVYDVLGRRVAVEETAGAFAVSQLASGVYVVRVEAGAQVLTRSVVVAR